MLSVSARVLRIVVALAVLASIAIGCAAAAPSPSPSPSPTPVPTPTPSPTPTPVGLLVEVTNEGGFINPSASLAALPAVVVDSDGHIYTPALSVGGIDRLVQRVDVRDVGRAGAAAILAAIRAAGLDREVGDGGVVADTGVTVFRTVIDGEEIINRFASNGPGGPGVPGGKPGASGDVVRQAAFGLLSQLTDPAETWGAGNITTSEYLPLGYRIYDAPAADAGAANIDWPLTKPLAQFGTPVAGDFGVEGLRSGVAVADDAGTLAAVLADAPSGATFKSEGHSYTVWIRALLPDELN